MIFCCDRGDRDGEEDGDDEGDGVGREMERGGDGDSRGNGDREI